MALGDKLRLARASTAQAQLADIKASEQLADRLARLGVQKQRVAATEAAEVKKQARFGRIGELELVLQTEFGGADSDRNRQRT